jgi:hypothetical protein
MQAQLTRGVGFVDTRNYVIFAGLEGIVSQVDASPRDAFPIGKSSSTEDLIPNSHRDKCPTLDPHPKSSVGANIRLRPQR